MSLEQTACEDLKAFERRLTEVIACLHPSTTRWRITSINVEQFKRKKSLDKALLKEINEFKSFKKQVLLAVVSICVATGGSQWIFDPETRIVSLSQSLTNHPFFILSTIILIIILLLGVHKRVIAGSIITSRTREVLRDFNMSCDDTGKLILRPRPTNIT